MPEPHLSYDGSRPPRRPGLTRRRLERIVPSTAPLPETRSAGVKERSKPEEQKRVGDGQRGLRKLPPNRGYEFKKMNVVLHSSAPPNRGYESTKMKVKLHSSAPFSVILAEKMSDMLHAVVMAWMPKTHVDNLHKAQRSASFSAIDVEPEGFSRIDKQMLSNLVKEKNQNHLMIQFPGGVQEVVSRLKTHVDNGIEAHDSDISLRQQTFGSNVIQMQYAKMLPILLKTLKDSILVVLLFLSASLSLGFGIKRQGHPGVSGGLFLSVSLFLVTAAISLCDIWATRQFHALSRSNNSISVFVIRNGTTQQISTNDVVVGDLVYLQTGDQVPADGLLVKGNSMFQVNESVLTKEANYMEPFLLSGSKVTDGYARMLVTAVGKDTKWGEMMSSKCPTDISTPLQMKLHKLTQSSAKVSLAVSSMVLMVLLIRYFTGNMKHDHRAVYTSRKSILHVFRDIIGMLVAPIIIASTAIPEGLQLAITLTLGYSTKKMAVEKAIVINLAACETIGLLTVLCVDRSSIISPKVEKFCLGLMNSCKKLLLHEAIGLNATSGSSSEFDELQIEKAIHAWAVEELRMKLAELKENCHVLNPESLGPQKKHGNICIKRNAENRVHFHMNGSIDMILDMCSHYYDENGNVRYICTDARENFKKIAHEMKINGLNCIAYAHAAISGHLDDKHFHPRPKDLALIGFIGMKYRFQPDISKVLKECQQAGVKVKMITTEDVPKAIESALECGIYSPNSTQIINSDDIIEGMRFRNITDEQERLETVERLSVIARASTSDKFLLVWSLKQKGHRVAVIGGFPGDENVFQEADVSFYPGIQESQLMKEKSDIIISDDSFTPIASAMRRGRGILYNIQSIVQFQLTATIVSLVTDSVATIFGGEPQTINTVTDMSCGKIPFAALQMLWVKLILGTLVVLALSTYDPAEGQMPADQRKQLITKIMWKDITGQSLCQIMILLTIQFKGESTFKLKARKKDTLIFTVFVLFQIFTIFNRVKVESLNKKKLFWMVIGFIVLLQVVIVELLNRFAGTERLDWKQWCACIGVSSISWLMGWSLRKIHAPEKLFQPLERMRFLMPWWSWRFRLANS